MTWLYWLSQITPSEQSLVGEKILLLSQLSQRGYPIVPGLVVESSLWTEFLSNLGNGQSLIRDFFESWSQVDLDNYHALQSLAQQSRRTVMEAEFSQLWQETIFDAVKKINCSHVVVRPSLVISKDQQQVSQRLLRSQICVTHPEAIVWGIKKVWSELFTAKSIFYWCKSKIALSQVKLNLLIQPIENVQASGTIELAKDGIVIRAIWGLEPSLDCGAVQPDIYLLKPQQSDLIEQEIGTKNIYYHLKNDLDSLAVGEDCLITDIVKVSLQEKAVLDDAAIKSLVKLFEEMISQNPKLKYLAWTSPQLTTATTEDHKFNFHDLDFSPTSQVNQIKNSSTTVSSQVLLTGIGAAPGKSTGQVFVNNSEQSNSQGESLRNYEQITPGSILVTKDLSPSEISLLTNLEGIIIETGSLTSHAAILARELEIPAIVNGKNATNILKTGELVTIDGNQGIVYAGKSYADKEVSFKVSDSDNITSTGIFDYPIGTRLMVNLSQDKLLDDVADLPIDGIGLLRSQLRSLDLINKQNSQSRIIDYLVNTIKEFAIKFAPRPVFYRSLDIPLSQLSTSNQDIGSSVRGPATYSQDPTFFDLELSALAKLITEGFSNINLILPFVRTVEEFIFCRDRFLAQGLGNSNTCQLWIMAEVPSVIFLLPEYIKAGVQGIVIGTGDLTRLLFSLDREQIDLNQYYNNRAFKTAIAQIISLTKNQQIPCSICLHGTDFHPDLIDNLINWGITNITVEPPAIRETYRAISRAEQRLLLTEITRKHKR